MMMGHSGCMNERALASEQALHNYLQTHLYRYDMSGSRISGTMNQNI